MTGPERATSQQMRVTSTQVDAARWIVKRDAARGRSTDEAVKAIANARRLGDPEAASTSH